MKPLLKIEGVGDLEKALESLNGLSARRVGKEVLTAAADPVVTMAKAIVPVRHGDLRDSIGVGTALTRRQKRLRQKIAAVEVNIGPGIMNKGGLKGVAHAHLVEFGTYKMAPRPYMTPAWQSSVGRVFGLIAEQLRTKLAAIAAKGARGG